jgi:hypothetical protein
MCGIVASCMAKGYIVDEICAELDIHRDTFFEWVKRHKEFSDAYKKGKTAFNAYYAEVFKKAMMGLPPSSEKEPQDGKETGRPNPAMLIFYMKVHCGWSETILNKADVNIFIDPQINKKLSDIFNKKNGRKTSGKHTG